MASEQQLGEQFVQYFYSTFDTNRANLRQLYTPDSMLTYEDTTLSGVDAIMEKYANLKFNTCKHEVQSLNVQPTNAASQNGVVVFCNGKFFIDDSPNPLNFAQMFHLIKANNTYFIINELFRLNIG